MLMKRGLRVNKALHWMHVVATKTLTWMVRHVRRGKIAIKELGLLPHFKGTLIHDGWESYRILACHHGLCNAHHLRELTYVYEELGQAWAGDMILLLKQACQKAETAKMLAPHHIEHMRYAYEAILDQGEAVNPRNLSEGKRGRIKQSKATNLLIRLREHADEVWRFMYDPAVPFTNNIAEQSHSHAKGKTKNLRLLPNYPRRRHILCHPFLSGYYVQTRCQSHGCPHQNLLRLHPLSYF